MNDAWRNFLGGNWENEIDVTDFVDRNYTPYMGDESFLAGPTERTKNLLNKVTDLLLQEHKNKGVLSIDASRSITITSHGPGYIDKENEIIVGLQTEKPLERGVNPFGGIRMARLSCKDYGVNLSERIEMNFEKHKTHNDGVFSVYNDEMKQARKAGILTGLPDAYGRGRIIGDYRRVPLYGVDRLIEQKKLDKKQHGKDPMTEDNIRLLEELFDQIEALKDLKEMAAGYGFDISQPAKDTKEAVQWLYFAYLGAIKEQNGAAMSLGRTSIFVDIYAERDLSEGTLTEEDVQEIIDDFILKLRVARHLRTPEYNELFAGDPMWITESIGGMTEEGKTFITKSAYRYLNTLYNLGPGPEPNMTILWSSKTPLPFKKYCAKVSIDTDSIQYENDDIMRPIYGESYGIACCVSVMKIGKQMQFFGARCNLAKILLMSINGGRDEKTGQQLGPEMPVMEAGVLDFNEVMRRYEIYRTWICSLYVNTMNIIHYMHDKYAYEKLQMALHDTDIQRLMAFGIAGLSVVADSMSAIKYAKVTGIKDEKGIISEFKIDGDFPKFGNDDDRVDTIAEELTRGFTYELKKTPAYRNAIHTLSILTITSNVVYGKKTGSTPDGRKSGEPFAPGANPMHSRDEMGALASLNSVAKIPFDACRDGISCTFSINPSTLGKTKEQRINNLVDIMDGYFAQKAHHLNVNVFDKETLLDAMNHPEKYPSLTIRVSGYAVKFNSLSREQQLEVISRTIHSVI